MQHKKLSKPRKINVGYHPEFIQWNWLAIDKAKEVEAVEQAPTPTKPAAASAAPVQPMETLPNQCQKSPKYCAICAPTGTLCPTEYPMPLKADWSDDSEEVKDLRLIFKIYCFDRAPIPNNDDCFSGALQFLHIIYNI